MSINIKPSSSCDIIFSSNIGDILSTLAQINHFWTIICAWWLYKPKSTPLKSTEPSLDSNVPFYSQKCRYTSIHLNHALLHYNMPLHLDPLKPNLFVLKYVFVPLIHSNQIFLNSNEASSSWLSIYTLNSFRLYPLALKFAFAPSIRSNKSLWS